MRLPGRGRRGQVRDAECTTHGFVPGDRGCVKCGDDDTATRAQVARRTGRVGARQPSMSTATRLEAQAALLDQVAAVDPAAQSAGRQAAQARAIAALYRRADPATDAATDADRPPPPDRTAELTAELVDDLDDGWCDGC